MRPSVKLERRRLRICGGLLLLRAFWLQNGSDVHSTGQKGGDDLGKCGFSGKYYGDLLYDTDSFVAVERMKKFRNFFYVGGLGF